ncbi:putative Pentatricopeptide repeat-containing protein [Cocos nucifera]|uniref:Putative Pentatricopeptide repeat-containing protein n=1 Tax=Cocos nucifera TaxID=13894 RepID=A0A8K0I836_COCNU|nr:putative Pentatricopeptide repeat-containing protein [Cocos nucifera]
MPPSPPYSPLLPLQPFDVAKLANRFAAHLQLLSAVLPKASASATTGPTPLLRGLRALHAHILASGFKPRAHILNRLIDLYAKSSDLPSARRLFDAASRAPADAVAATSLVNAYAASGHLPLARCLFDGTPLPARDTVFYNAMISSYARAGDGLPALVVFREMLQDGFRPDNYTFTGVLSAAAAVIGLEPAHCGQLHCSVVKSGTEHAISVSNALISLYFKCDSLETAVIAREVFDRMVERDALTWTTMVVGYVRRGDICEARQVFDGMEGRFNVAWNAMISGYVHCRLFLEALEMFRRMNSIGIPLDEFTYTSVLSACESAGLFNHGKAVHAHIIRSGPDFDPVSALPVENVLITLYSNCGKIDVAKGIFDDIERKDAVSWNAILTGHELAWLMMISGFVHNGLAEEGLKLFSRMRAEGAKPCDYTYASTIAACGELGALKHGQQLHAHLIQFGYESSNSAGNALLTMYAKCGAVEEACIVFLVMPNVDSISWSAMIAALGHHGHGREAIELFEQMIGEGIFPDRITFLTILSACNHAGLVDEGFQYFESMKHDYGISPGEDHYAQLIDLLAKKRKKGNIVRNAFSKAMALPRETEL